MENPLSNEPENVPEAPSKPEAASAPQTRPAIRTLHSDVAASVRNSNVSITKIALAQQAKNASLPFIAEEKPSSGWRFWSAWSIGTIILVVAGFAIIVGALVVVMSKNISLPFANQEPLAPTLLPVIDRSVSDTTRMPRAELIRTIESFLDKDYSSPVALEALILEELVTATSSEGEPTTVSTTMSLERFFERLGARAPGRLVRATGPEMTLGRAGATPFLITTTTSYETAFAGMLEWETAMAEDLSFITKQLTTYNLQLTNEVPGEISTSSIATTTSTDMEATSTASTTMVAPPPVPEPVWKDIVIKNRDVRALIAHDETVLVLYAFPKDGLMVITQTKEAFMLIVDALNAPVFGM